MLTKVKSLFGAQDMTVGSPMSCILKFAIPLLIGSLAQQLYNTADAAIVGRFVGIDALGAVGLSGPITNMFIVLFMTVATGVSVMVSQFFGAKDRDNLSKTVGNAVFLIAIITVILMVGGTPAIGPLLRVLGTPEHMYSMAYDYLMFTFLGIAGFSFYNLFSGILRGMGDSIFPLITLFITVILNVALDLLFVAVFGMGTGGAALATVISASIAALACLWKIKYKMGKVLDFKLRYMRPNKVTLGQVLKLGLPVGAAQAVMTLSTLFVQSLINSINAPLVPIISATTVVMRVDGFAIMPVMTFSNSASTFTGQNIGAGKMDRVSEGMRAVLKLSVIVTLVIVVLILLFGRSMMGWFIDPSEVNGELVKDLGVRFLRILAVAYIAIAISQVLGGVMRGAGDTMPMMWNTLISNVLLRVPFAYLMARITSSDQYPNGYPDIIYYSMLLSCVFGFVFISLYYRSGRWKNKSLIRNRSAAKLTDSAE